MRCSVAFCEVEGEGFDGDVFASRPRIIDETEDEVSESVEVVGDVIALFGEDDLLAIADSLPDVVVNGFGWWESEDFFALAECLRGTAEACDGEEECESEDDEFPSIEVPESGESESEEFEGDDDRHEPSDESPSLSDSLADFDESDPFVIAFCQDASII